MVRGDNTTERVVTPFHSKQRAVCAHLADEPLLGPPLRQLLNGGATTGCHETSNDVIADIFVSGGHGGTVTQRQEMRGVFERYVNKTSPTWALGTELQPERP
jgi:hypothetical protein